MGDTGHKDSSEVDPRHRLAQKYLAAARADLAAKEAEQPKQRRREAERPATVSAGDLLPSVSGTTIVHAILLAITFTVAALALAWCFALLSIDASFLAGRAIAFPVGILTILALSYASAFYLGILESTSHGHTTPDDALTGNWQDWFWSLPSTFGIAAAAAGIGWLLSLLLPGVRWQVIGLVTALLYPLMQLSTLETGSPLAPFSLPVLRTLLKRPLAWGSVYGISFVFFSLVALIARAAWRDPPYVTMLIMGPFVALAVLFYGLLLGTLARWLSLKGN